MGHIAKLRVLCYNYDISHLGDEFMKNNIVVDGIIGVSAGALFGANYFSNQLGRAIRYNKKYLCS